MASRKIGALWLRNSKDGSKKYMSGVISDLRGDIQIVIFENDRKEKDNQPDFNILVSEKEEEKKVEQSGFGAFDNQQDPPGPETSEKTIEYPEDEINPDDIPFNQVLSKTQNYLKIND